MKRDPFDVRAHKAHHGVAILTNGFAPGDDGRGRKGDFLSGIDQHTVSFSFRLDVSGIGDIGAVDGAGEQRLQPLGIGADGEPGNLAVRIDTVFAQRVAEQKIAERADARSRNFLAAQVLRPS